MSLYVEAMEARAQQRAERRKQIEEIKKKKEEEKLVRDLSSYNHNAFYTVYSVFFFLLVLIYDNSKMVNGPFTNLICLNFQLTPGGFLFVEYIKSLPLCFCFIVKTVLRE